MTTSFGEMDMSGLPSMPGLSMPGFGTLSPMSSRTVSRNPSRAPSPAPSHNQLDGLHERQILEMMYHQIVSMKTSMNDIYQKLADVEGQVALTRTELDDHKNNSRVFHEYYEKQLTGAYNMVTQVRDQVAKIPTSNSGSSRQPPPPPPQQTPRNPSSSHGDLKFPKPNKFSGKKEEALTFLMACNSYLDSKGTGVAEGDQINWVCQYLEGAALEWIQPYRERFFLRKESVPFLEDTKAFWAEFSKHFVDNNRDEKYRLKWNNLKQTKSVQEYIKDFQQYSVVLNYSDAILRDKFYDAQQVYDKAEEIDNHLEAYKSTTPAHSTSHSSSTSSSTARASSSNSNSNSSLTPRTRLSIGDPVYMIDPTTRRAKKGVIESIGRGPQGNMPNVKWSGENKAVQIPFPSLKKDEKPILNSAPAPVSKPDNKGPGPMDLDGRGIGSVTCNNCGGKGHFARACPSKAMSGHVAEVKEWTWNRPNEAKLIEVDSDEEESGKGGAKAN
ncbi:hypothetical protein RSOLAG1IB_12595 [Rhizoctonia solani AG-1 IB]|uniref:CCHC-type domain-containing protein n=1 Tax=Thanatephorus cucumeris (strain AG1-IB / isolate 7/3/14) TaxID=1108050 RepID=A0A0B7FY58_THACB|nr:hypothetical protein RSOLAG1IB_12595 [Rhizoctonia solani AG-1 IB]